MNQAFVHPIPNQPINITAYDHIKVAVSKPTDFEFYLEDLGFSRLETQAPTSMQNPFSVWGSGEAVIVIYDSQHVLARPHHDQHGDTIFDLAFVSPDEVRQISGAGGMRHSLTKTRSFSLFPVKRGILRIDHNTINLNQGDLDAAVNDYLKSFHLERGQFFHIHTKLTGLKSWVTRSPNFGVQIPFNEGTEESSQVQEYVRIHRGPGVQHLALLSEDLIRSMDGIKSAQKSEIKFLDIPDTYYELARNRMKIDEDFKDLEKHRLLVDGDASGYLLQIFTQNVFGGFFFELIQRKGNKGFGEGNFQALFESIELDQKRRGVL
jgi:4-hydroxyphenylpyruvate dioxygenase-like putative hemolysin